MKEKTKVKETDMQENARKNNAWVTTLTVSLTYIFLVYLNIIFPKQSDDIGRKLEGVQRAIDSYMHWNGRFGELMLVTFGSYFATTPWYAVVNAAIGTSVITMLFVLIVGRLPQSKMDVSIFSMLCMFLMLDYAFCFGSVFYWAAGSFNYLWAWFFILLLILPVGLFWHNNVFPKSLNAVICVAGIPLGIIAGWSSEFAIVLIMFWAASIVFARTKKIRLPSWYYSSLCAFIVGWIILYKCPGHHERAKLFANYLSLSELLRLGPVGLARRILAVFNNFSRSFYYENFCLVSLFLLLTSLLYKPSLKNFESTVLALFLLTFCFRSMPKVFYILCALFICIMSAVVIRKENPFVSNLFIALSGLLLADFFFIGATIQIQIPSRAKFQCAAVHIGIIALYLIFFFEIFKENQRIKNVATALCVCAVLCSSCFVGVECTKMHLKWRLMERSVEEQKAQGIMNVTVDKSTFQSKYWSYGDWGNPGENPDVWPNTTYAHYYGVETFVAK